MRIMDWGEEEGVGQVHVWVIYRIHVYAHVW